MGLKKDIVQLDIIIGNDQARKKLTELESESAKLTKSLKAVRTEHRKYDNAAKKMTSVQENLKKSKIATKELESELKGLKSQHLAVQQQIKKTGGADAVLIAKEKELASIIRIKNKELKFETSRYKSLEREQEKLIAVMKRTKAGNEEYIASSKRLAEVKTEIDKVRRAFDITKMSMDELEKEFKQLNMLQKKTVPGTEGYLKYEKRLTSVNTQMKKLQINSKKTANAQLTLKQKLGKAADGFNKFSAMAVAAIAALVGVWQAVKQVIMGLASYSDTISEVQKTTGLTAKEIEELQRKFKDFNTRTAKKELLEYSRIAGKLGIQGVEDISNFVEEANVAVVSLGKALGGSADETINTLGKVIGAFKLDEAMGWGKAIKHVGSVINELGKSSTASEKPIVEYISRLSSVGVAAEIPIEKVAALGATLDSLKIPAESGASSMMKFIYSLSENITEFSDLLDVSEARYKQMLDEDVNAVMIQVLKSAKDGKEGLLGITEAMDAADVNGVRMTATIGTLMNNIGELERQQAIATEEFKKGTSTMKEYDLMNNNFAGQVERTTKKIKSLFLTFSKKLKPAIISTMKAVNWLIDNFKNFNIVKSMKKDSEELVKAFKELFKAFKSTGIEGDTLKLLMKALVGAFKNFILPVRLAITAMTRVTKIFARLMKYSKPLRFVLKKTSEAFNFLSETSENANKSTGFLGKTLKWVSKKLGILYNAAKKVFDYLTFMDTEQEKKDKEKIKRQKEQEIAAKKQAEEDYNRHLNNLKRKHSAGLLAEEEYLKQIAELNKKYGKDSSAGITTYDIPTGDSGGSSSSGGGSSSSGSSGGSSSSGSGSSKADKIKSDTEAIKSIIQSMNLELIADEQKKAEAELQIWYDAEKKKIETSKVSAEIKNQALTSLELVHKQRLGDIESKAYQDSLAKFDEVNAYMAERAKALETDREALIQLEVEAIDAKYEKQLDLLRVELEKENSLYDQYYQQFVDLEKLRDDEIKAYKLAQEEKYNKDILAKQQELHDKQQSILEEYGIEEDTQYTQDMDLLDERLSQKLITEDNYQIAKAKIQNAWRKKHIEAEKEAFKKKLDMAKKHMQNSQAIIGAVSNFYAAQKDYELSKAGDNEEAKKAIMKKYADKEFAVKTASIIASTALAVMQAFAQLGPIGGAIAGALITATGIFQIAQANQARQSVRQLAKGKYPVVGEDDGKLYNADYKKNLGTGIVRTPTLVAEEPEMVIDHKTLYDNSKDKYGMTVLDHAKSIIAIKYNSVPQRASGKYDSKGLVASNTAGQVEDKSYQELLEEVRQLRADINTWQSNLKTYVLLDDILIAEKEKTELETSVTISN